MSRALCLLRTQSVYRRDSFCSGLKAAGLDLCSSISNPGPGDVLLIWNRYGHYDAEASNYERRGATVVIAENGYVRDGIAGKWFALAKSHHAGAGEWYVGSPERFVKWNLPLTPYRHEGKELVILGQRGIGEPGIAAPRGWAESVQKVVGGRIRQHPGIVPSVKPLAEDLKRAYAVATWSSAAALSAMALGVPVICAFPRWIGASACLPLSTYTDAVLDQKRQQQCRSGVASEENTLSRLLNRNESDRLEVFRRVAWAQWDLGEIQSGEAFRYLLHSGRV